MVLKQWFENKIRPGLILGLSSSSSSSSSSSYYFPEDILIQILVRLPAESLLLFKAVCRHWKSLISSNSFINLHLTFNHHNNNNPVSIFIFTHDIYNKSPKFGIYHVGFKSKGIMTRNMVRRISLPGALSNKLEFPYYNDVAVQLLASCDGLLFFDKFYHQYGCTNLVDSSGRTKVFKCIFIINPITRETREIPYPKGVPIKGGHVCAIFFDRFQHQHKLLHVWKSAGVYHIFSFRDGVWTRLEIRYTTPSSSLGHSNYVLPPCMHMSPPVIVADALHWLVDAPRDTYAQFFPLLSKFVMAFKIQTNEIHYFPHPMLPISLDAFVKLAFCRDPCLCFYVESSQDKMQLIENNGNLCLCHVIVQSNQIDLWILREYGDWNSWVKTSKVKLPHTHHICNKNIFYSIRKWGPIILSFPYKDVIAIKWKRNGIYLYHLVTHKSTCIHDDSMTGHNIIDHKYHFIAFNKTLLSPNISYKFMQM